MKDSILQILKEMKKEGRLCAYEVRDTYTEGWEFYFVRHRLDQNRVKEVEHIHVAVYTALEDGASIGRAEGEIAPTLTPEEIRTELEKLLSYASYVKNPYFTLNSPGKTVDKPIGEVEDADQKTDLSEVAKDFLTLMQDLPETANEDVNSYEIFVNRNKVHFLNSEGIDVTDDSFDSSLEVILNARKEGHEIELYRMYHSGTCDSAYLKAELTKALQAGKDKLLAVQTPALPACDLVLSGENAAEVLNYFISRSTTDLRYMKYSDWQIGGEVGSPALNLTALRYLPNSSKNCRFDAEGALRRDQVIIENGILKTSLGHRQFSQYLKEENTFLPGNYRVDGGTAGEEELRAGDYLEILDFSDFQVSPMNGDIAGEIRLGYWHHDGKVTPVSGGSVGGTMRDLAASMLMTKERVRINHLEIPACIRLSGIQVAAAGNAAEEERK